MIDHTLQHHHVYTLTAGRTGTAWLAEFIKNNLGYPSIHEYLGYDDIGIRTPDIRVMRHFNEAGMTNVVMQFWKNKWREINQQSYYCETNHTFSKCGLVEFLSEQNTTNRIDFICLKRDWVKMVASYFNRGDFNNYTTIWQWYLDYHYRYKIVEPTPFLNKPYGYMLWYISEMETRQAYYRLLYRNQFNFIDCTLEELVTSDGAQRVLSELGVNRVPVLPPPQNQNRPVENEHLILDISRIVDSIRFDPEALAKQYIESGQRLGHKTSI